MTSSRPHAIRRAAVERARARMPELAPDSVEVLEPVRRETYVVVRTPPARVVVLDEAGRLVRGRVRLTRIAWHLRAIEQVRAAVAEAQLGRKVEEVARSLALLQRLRRSFRGTRAGERVVALGERLTEPSARLDAVLAEDERQWRLPPTERALQRTISLLNRAAVADRGVVHEARLLAAEFLLLDERASVDRSLQTAALRRWLAGRLGAPDLRLVFVEAARG